MLFQFEKIPLAYFMRFPVVAMEAFLHPSRISSRFISESHVFIKESSSDVGTPFFPRAFIIAVTEGLIFLSKYFASAAFLIERMDFFPSVRHSSNILSMSDVEKAKSLYK